MRILPAMALPSDHLEASAQFTIYGIATADNTPMMKRTTISSISVNPFLVLELFNIITIYLSGNIHPSSMRFLAEENGGGCGTHKVGVFTAPTF